ncbi:MAG: peptidoglycan-binding protein [Clostridia bacterium]|nr:peptidoglycan-binding protein [Clostridia bacterium]
MMHLNSCHIKRFVSGLAAAIIISGITPDSALAVRGEVDCKNLILRKSASQTSKALQTLQRGDNLEIIHKEGEWYKVRYGRYTGYVMKKYVEADGKVESVTHTTEKEEKKTQQKAENKIQNTEMKGIKTLADIGSVPGTSRKGDTGTKVKKLQQALSLKGYYSGAIDGKYGSGTEKAVKAFQKSKGLSQDGIAGKVTIKLLFGQSAADDEKTQAAETYKTQKLNWFNGGSSAIPKGATFTVKDVKTGKTFTCRRWSGANHMDVEPLTLKDAQIMKSIYGGSWSWDRRAILVKYGENVYAASMNGMPHGSQTISGNGFDGHFCIHFYKSKTHGTKRVDPDHQNAVNQAARATW